MSVLFSALSTVSDCKGYSSFRLLLLMYMNTVLGVGRFCGSGSRKDCQPLSAHTLTASQPVNKVIMSPTIVDVVTLLVLFTAFYPPSPPLCTWNSLPFVYGSF